MASVFKRGGKSNRDGKYTIMYFDEFGVRRTMPSGTSDRQAAKEIAKKLETDAAKRKQGILTDDETIIADASKKSILDHVEDYLADLLRRGKSAAHVGNRRAELHRMIAGCGWKRLGEMRVESGDKWLDSYRATPGHHKKDTKSARSVNRHRTAVVAFANWCVSKGRLRRNPLKSLTILDEEADKRRESRALSFDERRRLLAAAPERRDAYLVMMGTALRVGTLKKLKVRDFGFDVESQCFCLCIARSKNKSKKDFDFPILGNAIPAIHRLIAGRTADEPLIPSIPSLKMFKADCRRAGIEMIDEHGRSPYRHAFRHTLATDLLRSGVDPDIVKSILGHSGGKRTLMKHYSRLGLKDAANAMKALPSLIDETAPANDPSAALSAAVVRLQDGESGDNSQSDVQRVEVARVNDRTVNARSGDNLTQDDTAVFSLDDCGRLAQLARAQVSHT